MALSIQIKSSFTKLNFMLVKGSKDDGIILLCWPLCQVNIENSIQSGF